MNVPSYLNDRTSDLSRFRNVHQWADQYRDRRSQEIVVILLRCTCAHFDAELIEEVTGVISDIARGCDAEKCLHATKALVEPGAAVV